MERNKRHNMAKFAIIDTDNLDTNENREMNEPRNFDLNNLKSSIDKIQM